MSANNISVTILTVTYNCEKTVAKTIESVLNQTYDNIEYLLIDGASTDGTIEIANRYQEAFKTRGISYRIISEPDEGMYDALNRGAKLASGTLVGQINSDDQYESNAVEQMVSFYVSEGFDIAWADIRVVNGEKSFVKKAKIGKLWTTAGFCHPTMFSKREILLKYPYACRALDDDFDFILRAHKGGTNIKVLNEVLADYSFGGSFSKKGFKEMIKRIQCKYLTYRRNGFSRLYIFYSIAAEFAKFLYA